MSEAPFFDLPKRYEPNGTTAHGGVGDIFVCKDLHLDRLVAIKTLRNPDDKSRIHDEINALMTLRSKHVVQAYDILIGHNNQIGIVLEYIEGNPLQPTLTQKSKTSDLLKTLWQIASGISDIHQTGIIHRDLNLSNLLLDLEGIVKIFDFGLSRAEGNNSSTTGFKGTSGYAAPELFGYGFVEFTTAVDVYAFGAMALILAAGVMPDAMYAFPPAPAPSNPYSLTSLKDLPEITILLEACLSWNASDRPDIAQVRDQLARYLVRDRHQGLAVINGTNYIVNSGNPDIGINNASLGGFDLHYDGLRFILCNLKGDVFVNAGRAVAGATLPGSCVIALGDENAGMNRAYVTFDCSNPEIAL